MDASNPWQGFDENGRSYPILGKDGREKEIGYLILGKEEIDERKCLQRLDKDGIVHDTVHPILGKKDIDKASH